jgi:protein-disulfide isomerase
LADGLAMGDPNAPVVVEVFEDFQCPACRAFTEGVEAQLIDSTYIASGQVYYIFRQYPFLDDRVVTSKESDQASNASMCAMEQGRFWDYHDMLYANQQGENEGAFNDKRLQTFAEALGLDMTAFNACFKENRYSEEISQDLNLGQGRNVTGTNGFRQWHTGLAWICASL